MYSEAMASPAIAAVAPPVQTHKEKPNFVLCPELVNSPEKLKRDPLFCMHIGVSPVPPNLLTIPFSTPQWAFGRVLP